MPPQVPSVQAGRFACTTSEPRPKSRWSCSRRLHRSHCLFQIDKEESDRRLDMLHLDRPRHGTTTDTLAVAGEPSDELSRWPDDTAPSEGTASVLRNLLRRSGSL